MLKVYEEKRREEEGRVRGLSCEEGEERVRL